MGADGKIYTKMPAWRRGVALSCMKLNNLGRDRERGGSSKILHAERCIAGFAGPRSHLPSLPFPSSVSTSSFPARRSNLRTKPSNKRTFRWDGPQSMEGHAQMTFPLVSNLDQSLVLKSPNLPHCIRFWLSPSHLTGQTSFVHAPEAENSATDKDRQWPPERESERLSMAEKRAGERANKVEKFDSTRARK